MPMPGSSWRAADMPILAPGVLYLLVALLCTNGVTAILWRIKAHELTVAELRWQASQTQAAEAATARLQAAIERGDALQTRVAAEETARAQITQEKTDALRRLTTGRACLGGPAVRLLNGPGLKPGAVPEAPGQPAGAAAAFATDTDVGLWAAGAIRAYDTCRGRIDALNDFFTDSNARAAGVSPSL